MQNSNYDFLQKFLYLDVIINTDVIIYLSYVFIDPKNSNKNFDEIKLLLIRLVW